MGKLSPQQRASLDLLRQDFDRYADIIATAPDGDRAAVVRVVRAWLEGFVPERYGHGAEWEDAERAKRTRGLDAMSAIEAAFR